jgi:hypothetical protein
VVSGMLAVSAARAADDVSVRIEAQPSNLSAGQQLELIVSISGAMMRVGQPQVAGLENFTVGGTSQSSSFNIVNGQMSASVGYVFSLFANQAGTFTLGPATVEVKGKTYTSNTVTVTVGGGGSSPAQPGAPAQPAKPQKEAQTAAPAAGSSAPDGSVFIQGIADRREVYVGEQVVFTFGFFYRTRLVENPEYVPATFNGFWVEQIDQNAVQSTRSVNGMTYVVQEIRYALFPTTAGEATITPAGLNYVVSDIWNFFDRAQRFQLKTNPITIKVKALPETGRPEVFSGAVGKYNLNAKLDKAEVKQGEPVTLEVTVFGEGNIKTLQEPKLPGLKDFDIYESKSEESISRSGAGISGKKTFRYVIVPRKPGSFGWDAVDYAYFDPSSGKYVLLHSQPVKFKVTPAEEGKESPGYRLAPEKVLTLGQDIHYIKENREVLRERAWVPFQGFAFWAAHALPFLFLGLALAWRRHRGRLLSDMGYARLKRSGRRLTAHLKEATKAVSAQDAAGAYASLDRALIDFIGDKLNTEARGMVIEQIISLLENRGLESTIVSEVRECLDHFAFARFAPSQVSVADAGQWLERVKELASRLEKAL